MKNFEDHLHFGLYPTPFYKLQAISAQYGRNIWIKRDDLCGVALGGNKVRKLEYLLADAQAQGCDTVFTTGGEQSNHAILTAACAARLGMKCILLLMHAGTPELRGNLILDNIYGAEVHFLQCCEEEIYAEMKRMGNELEKTGHKSYCIPAGGSNPLGTLGYVECVRELAAQCKSAGAKIGHLVSASGSGGTSAGLLLGANLYLPTAKVTGIGVGSKRFEKMVPNLAARAAELLGEDLSQVQDSFRIAYHIGAGYAISNAEDTPYIKELARKEGILLDPVYTGKAWAGMLALLQKGYFDEDGDIVFIHTGGAGALFAIDLANE